jgi:hypothetical protein
LLYDQIGFGCLTIRSDTVALRSDQIPLLYDQIGYGCFTIRLDTVALRSDQIRLLYDQIRYGFFTIRSDTVALRSGRIRMLYDQIRYGCFTIRYIYTVAEVNSRTEQTHTQQNRFSNTGRTCCQVYSAVREKYLPYLPIFCLTNDSLLIVTMSRNMIRCFVTHYTLNPFLN